MKPGSCTFRLVCKKKAQIVAAVYGQDLTKIDASGRNGDESLSHSQSQGAVDGGAGSSGGDGGELRRTASDPSGTAGSSSAAAGAGGESHGRGVLSRSKTSSSGGGPDDSADVQEYRRLRLLPRFARNAWFRQRKAWRERVATGKAAARRAWIPVAAYLDTRLGPHVLLAVLLPLAIYFFFGAGAVALLSGAWGVSHVAEVDGRQRRDLERRVKAAELGKFQGRRGHAKLHKDGSETADWWSEVLRSFWEGWLEFWLNRLLTRILTNVLAKVRPAYLESLDITTFKLGEAAPRINSSRCWRGNEGETVLEWDLVWQTEQMQIALSARVGGTKFAVPVPLRVYVSNLRLAGKFRLGLFWTRRKGGPYLSKLRLSFVDMPEHSVAIKPVTSSFIDVRDLPGVDTAIENALNKLFTNLLVEPNAITWDVEKWWINRPRAVATRAAKQGGATATAAGGEGGGGEGGADGELMSEAERICQAKGSSISSILAAGAGYSKAPTLMVAMSVHLAEIETQQSSRAANYYVRLKRGMKKYSTDAAKAVPQEIIVPVETQPDASPPHDVGGDFGGGGGGNNHRRSLSNDVGGGDFGGGGGGMRGAESVGGFSGTAGHRRRGSEGADVFSAGGGGGHHKRQGSGASDLSADFSAPPPPTITKWVARPVWEEFVRLDAFDLEIDAAVDIKVTTDDAGAVVGYKSTVGTALLSNILDYNDGRLHTVQQPLLNVRTGAVVGVLHLRVRVTAMNPGVVAANKDRNPNATLLTAPKTYTAQFALSAGGYLGKGVNDMSQAMRRNMTNAIAVMPIPQKYVDTAAKGMRAAALKAVNEPARQGRWAARSMYKGCKKFVYGKEKYSRLKREKLTREVAAAERAAGYAEAWKAAAAGASAASGASTSAGGGGGSGRTGGGGGGGAMRALGAMGGGGAGTHSSGGHESKGKSLHRAGSIEPSDLPSVIEENGNAPSEPSSAPPSFEVPSVVRTMSSGATGG